MKAKPAKSTNPQTIDEYIAGFSKDVRETLAEIRSIIRKAAPSAEEKISYQIPTFFLQGNLVHFAAFKKHIGLYPGSSGITQFQKEIACYESAKGSVQFPLDLPLPHTLISKMVKFRVKENLVAAKAKKARK